MPEGTGLNSDAPSQVAVIQQGDLRVLAAEDLPAEVEIAKGASDVRVEASIYYCQTGREQLCLYAMRTYSVPIERANDGDSLGRLSVDVGSHPA